MYQEKNFKLSLINLYLSNKYGAFFTKHRLGVSYFYLPSYYFIKKEKNTLRLIFTNEFFYKTFMVNFFEKLKMQYFFFTKLRIRGLGYRLWSICDSFHYFFFNYTITITFSVPKIWL